MAFSWRIFKKQKPGRALLPWGESGHRGREGPFGLGAGRFCAHARGERAFLATALKLMKRFKQKFGKFHIWEFEKRSCNFFTEKH